jgi:hypothetical protein
MEPNFLTAMPLVLHDKERLVKENLLGLDLADVVFVDALSAVAIIPIEPFDPAPVDHVSILP